MPERLSQLTIQELRHRAAGASSAMKVFPLPGVVLFPGIPLPLQIFEPRYRALVRDALAGDRVLALTMLAGPEDAPLERAEVHPVAGAAVIEAHERLADGRFNIVVRGAARVRLVTELDRGLPYREWRTELLEDRHPPQGPRALESQAEMLRECVYELSGLLPPESGAKELAEAAVHQRSPGVLADLVAAAVMSDPADRQAFLGELDVRKRLDRAAAEVASVILMLSQGKSPSV